MNERPTDVSELGQYFRKVSGWNGGNKEPYSASPFTLPGGWTSYVFTIESGYYATTSLVFLSGRGEASIYYVSQRSVYMSDGYYHDDYGFVEFGAGVMESLEITINLQERSLLTIHSPLGEGCESEPHNYPLLLELNETLQGYLEDIPELNQLLGALRQSDQMALARFDTADWSIFRQERDTFPFLGEEIS